MISLCFFSLVADQLRLLFGIETTFLPLLLPNILGVDRVSCKYDTVHCVVLAHNAHFHGEAPLVHFWNAPLPPQAHDRRPEGHLPERQALLQQRHPAHHCGQSAGSEVIFNDLLTTCIGLDLHTLLPSMNTCNKFQNDQIGINFAT